MLDFTDLPLIHPTCVVKNCAFGSYVELGDHCIAEETAFGDYTYLFGSNDVIFATLGKFNSIATGVRINPVNHPMRERVAAHHLTYRAAHYGLGEDDPSIIQWRRARPVVTGNDVWIGYEAVVLAGVTIGDGAIDRALDAIQQAREAFPEIQETPCHGIVHCQITRPDQLQRIREMGVQVLAQPVFLEYDLHMADLRVGPELGKTSYAWRTLAESGVPLSAGSDSPIESMDPLGNLYCAVTRQDYQGKPVGGWHPWECLTLEQALTAATAGVAFAAGRREEGRVAPGLVADFTVLDRDIFTLPPPELLHTAAVMTVVGGRIVHRRVTE